MRVYKLLLLGLLFLISVSLIFTQPGAHSFEIFSNFLASQLKNGPVKYIDTFIRYPPGVYAILRTILNFFPLDKSLALFYTQTAWVVHKFTLFIFYIFTWLALLHLARSIEPRRLSLVDVSIAYFASAAILLSSLALAYLDIFAAPFFILSLSFMLKRKFTPAGIFYLLSLSFNWTLLILAPLFLLFFIRSRRFSLLDNIIPVLSFLIVPALAVASYLIKYEGSWQPLFPRILSQTFSFPWLANKFSFSIFVKSLASRWVNILSHISIVLFALIYVRLFSRLKTLENISKATFLTASFCFYLTFILFFPGLSEGSLIWLVLISLVLFALRRTKFTTLQLILVNLLVFINLFVFFGAAGRVPPVRGVYFSLFQPVFAASFIVFAIWYIRLSYRLKFLTLTLPKHANKYILPWMKKFLVVLLIILNLSLITAQGSPDHVSWSQYARATIAHPNPFRAYTNVILQYPPLSIVIIGFFANLWKNLMGASETYAISTKISIFIFYLLAVGAYFKASTVRVKKGFGTVDKLLIILTTFALIIQTQGLADLNIYILPPLIISIVTLYKRKYFLSGLLLGLTISIKWQPIILLPLFGATLINIKQDIRVALRRSAVFLTGFLPIPVIAWYLVLIQPNGLSTIERSFAFFFQGAEMLSGQALNLNWIATYAIHIFQPERDVSLAHLGGLNRQIPTGLAPPIFQGSLFFLAAFIILLRYWLRQKKNIINFSAASVMIFFSHHILNKSAYEKHFFYIVALMLLLFLARPTRGNRMLLVLFDIMAVMNLIFFYGFTGPKDINRLFLGFDITVLFAAYYVLIFIWVLWRYLRQGGLLFEKEKT